MKEEEIVRGIKIIGDTLKMKFGVEKMKIGVIMGGVSSEKQVSIMTGNEMIAHLDKNKYEIVPITLNEKMDLIEKRKTLTLRCSHYTGNMEKMGQFKEHWRV